MIKIYRILVILSMTSMFTSWTKGIDFSKVVKLDEEASGLIVSIGDVQYSKKYNKIVLCEQQSDRLKIFDTEGDFLRDIRINRFSSDSVLSQLGEADLKMQHNKRGSMYRKVVSPLYPSENEKKSNNNRLTTKTDIYNFQIVNKKILVSFASPMLYTYTQVKDSTKIIRAYAGKYAVGKFDIETFEDLGITALKSLKKISAPNIVMGPMAYTLECEVISNEYIIPYYNFKLSEGKSYADSSVICAYSTNGEFKRKIGVFPDYLRTLSFNYATSRPLFCEYNNEKLIYSYETSDSIYFTDGRKGFKLKNLPGYSEDIYKRIAEDTSYVKMSYSEKLKTFYSAIRQIVRLNNGNILLWICKISHSNGQRDFQEHFQEYSTDGELVRELNINDLNERYGELKKICYVPEDNTIIEVRCGEEDWQLCHRKWND